METLLRNQLMNAFEPQYLEALRDINDMINHPIHSIITYLTNTYGQVSEEQYMQMEEEVWDITYDPALQVNIVFNNSIFCQHFLTDR